LLHEEFEQIELNHSISSLARVPVISGAEMAAALAKELME
jgi:hypothetical protein